MGLGFRSRVGLVITWTAKKDGQGRVGASRARGRAHLDGTRQARGKGKGRARAHLDGEEDGQDGLQDARDDAGVVEVLREELACVG